MFLKIIHKSEVSFICVLIRKKVILNRLEDLFALNICAQNFSVLEIIVKVSRLSKAEQSKILGNIIVIGKQLSSQITEYQKTATLKTAFFLKKTSYFYGYTWLENILAANCLNIVCNTHRYVQPNHTFIYL